MAESDRLFNPSRHTARILARAAQIGPQTAALAQVLFARLGRSGQRALYGLASLPRTLWVRGYRSRLHAAARCRLRVVRGHQGRARATRGGHAGAAIVTAPLTQAGPCTLRALTEYQTFWEQHATDEASVLDAAVPA